MRSDKTSKTQKETRSLRFLYRTAVGRLFLKMLVSRGLSKVTGKFMDSSLSRPLIRRFIRKNGIRLSDYEKEHYRSFNECFTRKIKAELRPIPMEKTALIAPCDSLLSVYPIHEKSVFHIKGSDYSVKGLLGGNEELAARYAGGTCLVFRLCVHHYHRYIYMDNGTKGENFFIKGKLHTVRPIAFENFPVFIQNCREYTVMQTENFGTVTQIEVGALLVGKIHNHHGVHTFKRGEEKGMFLYGGSTVVLLLEKGAAVLGEQYLESTRNGAEIEIKMGEVIGSVPKAIPAEDEQN